MGKYYATLMQLGLLISEDFKYNTNQIQAYIFATVMKFSETLQSFEMNITLLLSQWIAVRSGVREGRRAYTTATEQRMEINRTAW